jgi:hypothetical protein
MVDPLHRPKKAAGNRAAPTPPAQRRPRRQRGGTGRDAGPGSRRTAPLFAEVAKLLLRRLQ